MEGGVTIHNRKKERELEHRVMKDWHKLGVWVVGKKKKKRKGN